MKKSPYPPSGTTYEQIKSFWKDDEGFVTDQEVYVRHGDTGYSTFKLKNFSNINVFRNENTIGGCINEKGCSMSFVFSKVYLTKAAMQIPGVS